MKITYKNSRKSVLFVTISICFCAFFVCITKNCYAQAIYGTKHLSKTLFFMDNSPYIVNLSKIDRLNSNEIYVCTGCKLFIIDAKNQNSKKKIIFHDGAICSLKQSVIFSNEYKQPIVMVWGPQFSVGLKKLNGETVWMYKPPSGASIYSMVSGDLDNNGALEFYIATDQGLFMLDSKGNKIWEKGSLIHDVTLFVSNNKSYIITINNDNKVQHWSSNGAIIKEITPFRKINTVATIDWPQNECILTFEGKDIVILNTDGESVFEYNLKEEIYDIRWIKVKFFEDENPYIVMLSDFKSNTGKSLLCIFSSNGEVFYKETINTTLGLLNLQTSKSNNEVLLVGDGPGKIYLYKPRRKKMTPGTGQANQLKLKLNGFNK